MEWVSLKNRAPEKDGHYLFRAIEAINNDRYLCSVKYWCRGEIRPFDYAPSVCFTHWQPLPPPPKED